MDKHPGGSEVVHLMAGRDATDAFASYHPFTDKPEKVRVDCVCVYVCDEMKSGVCRRACVHACVRGHRASHVSFLLQLDSRENLCTAGIDGNGVVARNS